MVRQYMNIRISYDTKLYIEKIQFEIQETLRTVISNKDYEEMEKLVRKYLKTKFPILSGISITNILKVSTSSVIEEACRFTSNYSFEKWKEIDETMKEYKFEIDIEVGTLTPKLYLEEEVIKCLRQYQIDFKVENILRVPTIAYIVKLVVFAYYLNFQKNKN